MVRLLGWVSRQVSLLGIAAGSAFWGYQAAHALVESRLACYYLYSPQSSAHSQRTSEASPWLRLHKLHTDLQLEAGPQSLSSKLWALGFFSSFLVGWFLTSRVDMLAVCVRSLYSMLA